MTRNYRREYMTYDGKPSVKRKRANRNQARRIMTKAGVVRKGDGKDVHHRNGNTRDNRRRNRPANTFERYKEHSSPRSPCSRDVRCQSYPPHAQTQAFTRLRTYAGAISLACLAKNVRNKQTKTQQPQRRRRMSLRRRRRRLTREVRCATRSTTI